MSTTAGAGGSSPPGAGDLPIFTRKATGLVREVSLFNQFIFNAAATSPLGTALVFALFALVLFPQANVYVSFIVALVLGVFVWVTFSLMSAAIPRIGGDYTFNSRVLHPWIGFGGNLCVFVSSAIASGLWAWWFCTQALAPAFLVIGSATNNDTWTSYGNDLSGGNKTIAFLIAIGALLVTSLLAMRGTKTIVRWMTILFLIAAAGFVVDILILLFTSHDSFKSTVDSSVGPGTYQKTVDAGAGSGLYPSEGGHSTKNTIGAIYSMIGITMFTWWGTYLSAEFKGAGQRKRQLITMVGAGLGQGILVLLAMLVFLTTVGRDFFTSALAGNFPAGGGTVGTAGYAYFSSLVADNTVVVIILALAFIGWWLPGLYVNTAMCQRAIFTWSFDGLLPKKAGEVNERTHTPVIAIVVSFLVGVAAAAWVSYSSNFFKIFAVMQLFAYVPIILVGISAVLIKRRRPDLYVGSPAQWRIGGIEVLPVAGALCALVGAFACALVYYFHENLGVTGGYFMAVIIAPFVVFGIALGWWLVARSIRKSEGIDLDLVYKAIPPD